ncbi:MAG: hypothetical protein ACK4VN_13175 [Bacteroidales bacterium]
MTHSEVHSRIQGIIRKRMKVRHRCNSFTANFSCDYKMADWEVNLLLYFVEEQFRIRLSQGLEKQIRSMNQLVSLVYNETVANENTAFRPVHQSLN